VRKFHKANESHCNSDIVRGDPSIKKENNSKEDDIDLFSNSVERVIAARIEISLPLEEQK
jgi:hypothetical protein